MARKKADPNQFDMFADLWVPSAIEVQRRKRINASLWAYAYEMLDAPIVSDAKFDETCRGIKPKVATGNVKMDRFFKEEFSEYTGGWIHKHPDLKGIKKLYTRLKKQGVIK